MPTPLPAPATRVAEFISSARKAGFLLFSVALLLACGAAGVRGQSPAQAINLSTRVRVQTDENAGYAGFIITGATPKHVLIRALGPSLAQFSIPGVLANPTLKLNGPSGFAAIINDNWMEDPAQMAAIIATGIPPTNNLEAAIVATLNPGAYTAEIKGENNSSGVGLIEVYDLSPAVGSKLANISTRALVGTADNIVIAGFTLGSNSGGDSIVVRGLGPSLAAAGVSNPLADPTLELHDSEGALLAANNDWQDGPDQGAEVAAAGLALPNPVESGLAVSLPPGSYTALLAGFNTGTGVGLVEVYDLGTPAATVNTTVTRVYAGNGFQAEEQHVAFNSNRFTGTFRISVYHPSVINQTPIGARAALHGQTDPISFTASAREIESAIRAVPMWYGYGQLGQLEFGPGSFNVFGNIGAIQRDPVVTLDAPDNGAASGFTIRFGTPVGTPIEYNTWVTGMPLITIAVP